MPDEFIEESTRMAESLLEWLGKQGWDDIDQASVCAGVIPSLILRSTKDRASAEAALAFVVSTLQKVLELGLAQKG